MCGIAGIFNFGTGRKVDESTIQGMCDVIAHRGPDGAGIYRHDEAGLALGHRRLSILDLTLGQQPMAYANDRYWTVFNGEIYNYRELRRDLEVRGCSFRTTSDTEVLLAAYATHGVDAFAKLNGIFACALYDSTTRELVIARDRFGVKPVYLAVKDGTLVFASEIKAVLQVPTVTLNINPEHLATFLQLRYTPSPATVLEDVDRLPPGSFLRTGPGRAPSIASYGEDTPTTRSDMGIVEATKQYRALLEQAVTRQMVSDVPVGLLLSGGIDSAIVGLHMRDAAGYRIKTFTVGFEGDGDFNELDDARATARFLGSDHHERTISQREYLDFFFDSFGVSEEPIAEPTIPALHFVSKLAAEHVKVVLSGQGADEPLAGYRKYFAEQYLDRFGWLLRALPLPRMASVFRRSERLKRGAYASTFSTELERFFAINTIFTPVQLRALFLPEVCSSLTFDPPRRFAELHVRAGGLHDSLTRLLFMDVRTYLADDLLIFGDKVSMAHSLELRVPFLDNDLMAFIESLPGHMKLRGNTHKLIHRRALSGILPPEMLRRKKRGFLTPVDGWFRTDLGHLTRDLMNAPDSPSRDLFDLRFTNGLIERHQRGEENFHRHLFALLSWELWLRALRAMRGDSSARKGD